MADLFYSSPRARFFDTDGNPLSLGRVSFYFPGTTTLKEIYTDASEATPAQNPQPLDIEGYVREGGVWLGAGLYDVKLEASDNSGGFIDEWVVPSVPGGASLPSGSVGDVTFIDTVVALTALTAGSYGAVYVYGYWEPGDGGQGWFLWEEDNTTTPDGGYIVAPIGTPTSGRWVRVFEAQKVTAAQWGATSTAPGTVNSALIKAEAYVKSVGAASNTLDLGTGELAINAPVDFDGDMTLVWEDGCVFTGTGSVEVRCRDAIGYGTSLKVQSPVGLNWDADNKSDAYIEWWGTGADDFERATYNGRLVFTGAYTIGDPTSATPYTIERPHFEPGSTVTWNTTLAVTLDTPTYDKLAENVFLGTYDKVYCLGQTPVRLYDSALTTSTEYAKMLESVTSEGTRRGFLLWDKIGTMNLASEYTTIDREIESEVTQGTLISLGAVGSTYIGRVTNGPQQIFSNDTLNVPTLANGRILLQWFGTSNIDATSNLKALNKANSALALVLATQPSAYISGLGANLNLEASISLSDLRLKDVVLEFTDVTTVDTITLSGECLLDNMQIVQIVGGFTKQLNFTDTLGSLTISKCKLKQFSLDLQASSVKITDSEIGVDALFATDFKYTNLAGNLKITSSTIACRDPEISANSTTILSSEFNIQGNPLYFRESQNIYIKDSSFSIGGFVFTLVFENGSIVNPAFSYSDIQLIGNTFNRALFFDYTGVPAGGPGLANRVGITGNHFTDEVAGLCIVQTGIANIENSTTTDLHGLCVVKDNVASFPVSTEVTYQLNFPDSTSQPTTVFEELFGVEKVIFPRRVVPLRGDVISINAALTNAPSANQVTTPPTFYHYSLVPTDKPGGSPGTYVSYDRSGQASTVGAYRDYITTIWNDANPIEIINL